ncbi:DNA cytosine methyltransferase [Pseudomonas agarici]|uniref:DNA cytosine methyltransferase n=1 Tax=Pseudomonas agarici TaxID=46677 RepID=UPI0003716738|nr:DNA cytosine methyltransferase [Pseudomonas agarici]NWC11906.1 DNA cytosine methyltransferase [Pseudomonas agarici]SEL92790.1 DNA (cytosine-5)-methyltransferase 1 [Pseudomonas agarici]
MAAYYNEIDPYAAQWLRNLIEAGHIAPGIVDERSIEDVHPSDLREFTQCHFFAGVGVWSLALRRAGWADDRSVWTGSCPCQPFSAAGAGAGFADPRHLWPSFAWLISQCKPAVIFGEQVASKAIEPWVDLVQADLEALEYAFGAVPFPSAGVGAPHIRDRLYWVADAESMRRERGDIRASGELSKIGTQDCSGISGVAYLHGGRCASRLQGRSPMGYGPPSEPDSGPCGLANADGRNAGAERQQCGWQHGQQPENSWPFVATDVPGPVNGFWRAADWLGCRDHLWRPVEPGTFPMANGLTGRVGRLRAYGNAINAEAATQFIAAYLET